jgi:mono/diheme cytochrome c family protein
MRKLRIVTSLYRAFIAVLFLGFVLLPGLQAQSSANTQADAESGATLFRDKGCAYCHGMDLSGTKKAPALADVRNDKAWTPDKMTNQILNGGQKMPSFRESLSDDEIAQLIAFLRAKKRPPVPAGESAAPAN